MFYVCNGVYGDVIGFLLFMNAPSGDTYSQLLVVVLPICGGVVLVRCYCYVFRVFSLFNSYVSI